MNRIKKILIFSCNSKEQIIFLLFLEVLEESKVDFLAGVLKIMCDVK